MARSIENIQKQVQDVLVDELAQIGININTSTWSATNIMRLFCHLVAFFINFLENLFDLFTTDVNAYIANMKPHSLRWYVNKALAFQFGFELLPESDQFDNGNATEEQIAESKVVSFADAVEVPDQYGKITLRIKTAAKSGTDLEPITPDQLTALKAYFARIKDAGVPLTITSDEPDSLVENWVVYYDPLVFDANGNRLDGTEQNAIRTAIKAYLLQIPFDSIYALQLHENYVKALQGVVLCSITNAQSRYGNLPYTPINKLMIPDAGYLRFINENDLQIQMIAHSPIGN